MSDHKEKEREYIEFLEEHFYKPSFEITARILQALQISYSDASIPLITEESKEFSEADLAKHLEKTQGLRIMPVPAIKAISHTVMPIQAGDFLGHSGLKVSLAGHLENEAIEYFTAPSILSSTLQKEEKPETIEIFTDEEIEERNAVIEGLQKYLRDHIYGFFATLSRAENIGEKDEIKLSEIFPLFLRYSIPIERTGLFVELSKDFDLWLQKQPDKEFSAPWGEVMWANEDSVFLIENYEKLKVTERKPRPARFH